MDVLFLGMDARPYFRPTIMATTKKTKTIHRNLAVTCPHCGIQTKVPGNGLFHCLECGAIFSVDLAPMTKPRIFKEEDSCGATVADWITRDMGLFPVNETIVDTLGINNRKNLPIVGSAFSGTLPWQLTTYLKSRGADITLQDLRLMGKGTKSLEEAFAFDEDERLIVGLMADKIPHWVGCRKIDGKVKLADSLGTVTWESLKKNRGPLLIYKVSRRLHHCPLRLA